jgi:predicted permease
MTARDLWLRLRALVLSRRVERELHEELDFHVEMQTRRHLAAGLDATEARRLAHAQFGSTALVEDRVRDARGIRFFETLLQDLRYAVRSFRRAPAFALTVVGTIALGLGLNTAVFTIFSTYVLKPFDIRDPYSLYEIGWISNSGVAPRFTWLEYDALTRDQSVFSEVLAEQHPLITRIEGHTSFVRLVSGNYFRMLGVNAALGRTLERDDASAPGSAAVAVISHALWERVFGGDPAVLGRKVLIQGQPCEIIGVARQGFDGLDLAPPTDAWIPITLARQMQDGADLFGSEQPRRVLIVGRLTQDMTERTAVAPLLLWMQNSTRHLGRDDQARSVGLVSRATSIPLSPMTMFALSPVIGAFASVLLIACANVANMMLARGMARQREIGIRLTLGAGRARLVTQLLTESTLLAVPSAAAGFLVSRLTIQGGVHVMFATMPSEFTEFMRVAPLPPDVRVFTFMVVAALVTGILFGLAPALQTTRASVVQMARGDFGSDFGPSRLRSGLVVAQITASVMLLITAAVLVRTTQRFAAIDPGVRTHDVITLAVRDEARARIVSALESHRLVTGIASASTVPMDETAPEVATTTSEGSALVRVRYRYVSASYFDLFDLPILAGRAFTTQEAESGAAVAILSESAAARLWPADSRGGRPGAGAIGQTLHLVPDHRAKPGARIARFASVRVVGVTRDTAADLGNSGPMTAAIHFPSSKTSPASGLVVRVSGEPEAARRSLDAALAVAAPGAVQEIHKLQEFVAGRLYPFRAAYWVSGAVGTLALLLTLSGMYGVLSYLVTQRAKEISIRMALGANVSAVVSLVIGQSLRLAAIGLPIGVLLALGAARLFGWRVMMLQAFDPFSYVAGTLVVVGACVLASTFPALRAARIDPMTTLRAD